MGTATSIGGPPSPLLFQHRRAGAAATLAAVFALGTVLSLLGLVVAGALAAWHVRLALALCPGTLAGLAASSLARLDAGWLRPAVLTVAAVAAAVPWSGAGLSAGRRAPGRRRRRVPGPPPVAAVLSPPAPERRDHAPGGQDGGVARRDPLEDYRHLNDPARRRRRAARWLLRDRGMVALQALLESPYPVRSVLATRRKAERVRRLVAGRARWSSATTRRSRRSPGSTSTGACWPRPTGCPSRRPASC